MPELPEVETVVKGLRFLVGKKIKNILVTKPKLVSVGPEVLSPKRVHGHRQVREFVAALKGRRILKVARRAKLIIIELDEDWWLLVHLKMAGQLIIQKAKQKRLLVRLLNSPTAPLQALPGKHTHIVIEFSDGTKLFYNDIRIFGTWRAVKAKDLGKVDDLQGFGPEPLAKNFTPALLRSRLLKRANLKIKQALTEQSLLAGVGNIYADETLFAAKIRPLRQVKKLQRQEWPKLYQALQKVLKKAIIEHGSSVGDFIQTNGQPGNFGNFHKVYDRKNQPCRVCKTLIKRVTLGGRSAHFCPHCQR